MMLRSSGQSSVYHRVIARLEEQHMQDESLDQPPSLDGHSLQHNSSLSQAISAAQQSDLPIWNVKITVGDPFILFYKNI